MWGWNLVRFTIYAILLKIPVGVGLGTYLTTSVSFHIASSRATDDYAKDALKAIREGQAQRMRDAAAKQQMVNPAAPRAPPQPLGSVAPRAVQPEHEHENEEEQDRGQRWDGASDRSAFGSQSDQPSTTDNEGDSAWDKIRRGAMAAKPTSAEDNQVARPQSWVNRHQQAQQMETAQSSDSYTYSTQDEDKAIAKARAQKEFDEMLERERRGDSGN